MQEKSLLEKVREANRAFLKTDSQTLNISTAVDILAGLIETAVFAVDLEGCPLGRRFNRDRSCDRLEQYIEAKGSFPDYYHTSFVRSSNEPQVNVLYQPETCALAEDGQNECDRGDVYLTVIPILGGGQRVGTLLLHRCGLPFEHDDIILAEMGAAFMGFIFMRLEEDLRQESARNKALAGIAFDSLSYSEVEAIEQILRSLKEDESIVVASKVADELGITRSVIVNALRKFESAGIIESRSLGMKGTYIRIKNQQALKEIAGRSSRMKHIHQKNG